MRKRRAELLLTSLSMCFHVGCAGSENGKTAMFTLHLSLYGFDEVLKAESSRAARLRIT